MENYKQTLGKLLLLLGAVLFALLVVESYLRLTMYSPVTEYIFDRDLGFKSPPLDSFWCTSPEFRQKITFNRGGWRDVDHSLRKNDNVYRILVLGDSMMEGIQVGSKEIFPRRLEVLLNQGLEGRKRVEVLNLATSGYGTIQEYLLLKKCGLSYQPDLVILAFLTANDIRNNSLVFQDGTRDWSRATRPYVEVNETGFHWHPPSPEAERIYNRQGWKYWILDQVFTVKFLYKQLSSHEGMREWLKRHGLMNSGAFVESQGIPVDYNVYAPILDKDWRHAWLATEYILSETRDLLASKKTPFVVVVLTNAPQIYPGRWQAILDTYPKMQGKPWRLDMPDERLVEILGRLGIDYLQLLPVFRDAAAQHPEMLLHFPLDGHWTAAGHDLAARSVSSYLLSKLRGSQ